MRGRLADGAGEGLWRRGIGGGLRRGGPGTGRRACAGPFGRWPLTGVAHKLSTLRDERTDSPTFRRLTDELVTL
ncbi:hypothetical protein AB0A85_30360, partial [Kitasatospora aureofaciens]